MTRHVLGFAVLCCWIGAAGCAERPVEQLGHINVPLTAPGAGGTSYRLPSGTQLLLSSATYFGEFPLDGDAPSLTVNVPPDDYAVSLFNRAGYTSEWPLVRSNADGMTETVQATLDAPPTIRIATDQTTTLSLRFHVALAGPVAFSNGALDVSIEVDEAAAGAFEFQIAAPSLTVTLAAPTEAAPFDLAGMLPVVGSADQRYVVTAQTTGPWYISQPDLACAPIAATVNASGDRQFGNFITEAYSSDGLTVCVQQLAARLAQVSVFFQRAGAAVTPLLASFGDHSYSALYGIAAAVNDDLFDGSTLQLRPLEGSHPTTASLEGELGAWITLPDRSQRRQRWFRMEASGTATLTMIPR